MDKKRIFRILNRADRDFVAGLASEFKETHAVTVLREPNKTLAMIRLREPVKESLFYIGEAMVSEAVVELDGTKGAAVSMGDDFDKTLDMAILDAACNRGVFHSEEALLALEQAQREAEEKENALHLKTMVSFRSMDPEVPAK
ncbi:phosphonate C-P lyase system protein PhnG [Papillibacter cinnamivorans]|uniref:Alpha-D-ribose 1-methylphosphonate 5-triphosphate synthase subunit PhnG n=1 Tax=Papillibacter cinnamivorans DSM 12816 TaxID=1122930 RepID=A0A1W2BB30_9FIRM|nr:phosphonate C-P lyase system protein PhnG [Papillibacter cinnamivorans]SMC70119.1 alpha-D-ribose 1-methylphosphonate 5-triphosphate synthase subunit PhnG [Papillibacter cinnamivorans DSM 12816]